VPPAARLTDLHVCPLVSPVLPPVPHVGGPILGPGCPTVMIVGMPAACVGDMCFCAPPALPPPLATIVKGSMTVLVGGKPLARIGDLTSHGSTITVGAPTVMAGG
jgi:uncharacterized Zn-binding protein involved in type VI secretion